MKEEDLKFSEKVDLKKRIEENREEIDKWLNGNYPIALIYMRVEMLSAQNENIISKLNNMKNVYSGSSFINKEPEETWTKTMDLRYEAKHIVCYGQDDKWETGLQQRLQGSNGGSKWEFIEDINF